MSYLLAKVRDRFSFLPSTSDMLSDGEHVEVAFRTERAYCPYVRKFAEEHIADVIAIGYKYAYFEKQLALPLLKAEDRRLLLTALVAADYPEDKAYALRKLRGQRSYCLDGVYNFRLRELARRWAGIVDYVPTDMGEEALDGFLGYLTEDGEGKIFLKDGKVYDDKYRVLTKSVLTGKETVFGEIILGGAEKVYCFGETDEKTARLLKKYYGEKAVFC